MTESYRPTVMDVARLVSGTRAREVAPEAAPLLHYLIQGHPELRELWERARAILDGGVTLLEVLALQRAIETDEAARARRRSTACATAVKLIQSHEETRELWERLEQMGRDAGLSTVWPQNADLVVAAHDDVDCLLATPGWTRSEECLDPARHYQPEPGLLVRIVEARLSRGEGDGDRLTEVRDKLRAEIAESQPEPLAGSQPEQSLCN